MGKNLKTLGKQKKRGVMGAPVILYGSNSPNNKNMAKEEQFHTLEEVLGFLHKFEESERIRDRLFVCLMGLRDGVSEVTIHRKEFHVGNQILMVKSPERFHKLFWGGFGFGSKK